MEPVDIGEAARTAGLTRTTAVDSGTSWTVTPPERPPNRRAVAAVAAVAARGVASVGVRPGRADGCTRPAWPGPTGRASPSPACSGSRPCPRRALGARCRPR
ncbi:hypothetical protein ACWGH7_30780 [Streptomyces cyaneofuscatus]